MMTGLEMTEAELKLAALQQAALDEKNGWSYPSYQQTVGGVTYGTAYTGGYMGGPPNIDLVLKRAEKYLEFLKGENKNND